MTILDVNIKLRQSERLTDFADGGGKMTSHDVVDGQLNNIFANISDLDRTQGRVSLRKAFLFVNTTNSDTYYGAHAILTAPPNDANVRCTLFSTNSFSDVRENAKDRIESYTTLSVVSRFALYGNHLAGQRAISVFTETNVASPDLGDSYALVQTLASSTTVEHQQYVRIQRLVSRSTLDFVDDQGKIFQKDVLVLELSAPLRYDFLGKAPTPTTNVAARTLVYTTTVADAARYFGIQPLTVAATVGALTVNVASIFDQLVPAAQTEVPAVDVRANGDVVQYLPSTSADVTYQLDALSTTVTATRYVPTGIVPGSLHLIGSSIFDDGAGKLVDGAVNASINYATGRLDLVGPPTVEVQYKVAAVVSSASLTNNYPITAATRAYNYVFLLDQKPAPGSFFADYKAAGKWYRLQDNGAGQLAGAAASIGAGTVNYTTGSVVVTVGALPDVNTQLLYGWGVLGEYTQRTNVTFGKQSVAYTLVNTPITPGSLSITIPTAAAPVTATADAAGVVTGSGVAGFVDVTTGQVNLTLDFVPPNGSQLANTYTTNAATATQFTGLVPNGSGFVTFTLPGTARRAGSVQCTWLASGSRADFFGGPAIQTVRTLVAKDNGAGQLMRDGSLVGTVNYTTGAVSLLVTATAQEGQSWGPQKTYIGTP